MKKIKLPNGHKAYSLSEEEEASVKSKLSGFRELRRDTVYDLIYKTDEKSILVLYKSQDGKLIFDHGQAKYWVLIKEDTYNYFLNDDRNYQAVHSLDFIDLQSYKDFAANVDNLVDSFCERKSISKYKLTGKTLKDDIVAGGEKVLPFLKEQVAVMSFLKGKEGFKLEVLQLFGSDQICTISMVNREGDKITPSQLVAEIYLRSRRKRSYYN